MSSLEVSSYPGSATPLLSAIVVPDASLVPRTTESAGEHREDVRSTILREVSEAFRTAHQGVTNIESVVAMTSIPPARIATEFGSMNGLLVALVGQLAASMLEPLARRQAGSSFETQLLEFAHRVADTYSFSHLRSLYRIALNDSVRNSGTARTFYQRNPGRMKVELARFIQEVQRGRVIDHASSLQLASHFMALLRADLDLVDTDLSGRPPRKIDISAAMDLFRAGIRKSEMRSLTTDPSRIDGFPDALAMEVDANGSPLTLQESDWLVCFVPGLRRQWWHRFTNAKHEHVFALRIVDEGTWILFEPW